MKTFDGKFEIVSEVPKRVGEGVWQVLLRTLLAAPGKWARVPRRKNIVPAVHSAARDMGLKVSVKNIGDETFITIIGRRDGGAA